MEPSAQKESWSDSNAYDLYVGRWSRLIGVDFVKWLDPLPHRRWLEAGCGTGSLTSTIVSAASPAELLAIDKSEAYLAKARERVGSPLVSFSRTDVADLRMPASFDYITSGLVLNFLPDVEGTFARMVETLKPGGSISAFVWDYAGHYQPMRMFWDSAREVHRDADKFDAGIRYPLCSESNLTALFKGMHLSNIRFTALERIATFRDFDDYWLPIASAQGSVTEFLAILTAGEKNALKELLKKRLPAALNGEIKLIVNALAIEGRK